MIRRSLAAGCIIFGSLLLYVGWGKTQSVVGEVSRTFTGEYSTETMMYLIGGGVLLLVGLSMLLRKGRRS